MLIAKITNPRLWICLKEIDWKINLKSVVHSFARVSCMIAIAELSNKIKEHFLLTSIQRGGGQNIGRFCIIEVMEDTIR